MSSKIFICGRTYDLATNDTETIEKRIQKRVDRITCDPDSENPNQRFVEFSMQVAPLPDCSALNIELTFIRNNPFAKEGVNPELINDADAKLIMGMDGHFKPAVMWNLVEPFAFGRYHVPLSEFVHAYVNSAEAKGVSEITGLQIESTKTELKLKIKVQH